MRAAIVGFLVGVTFCLPARADEPAAEKKLRADAMQQMADGRLADARDTHLSLWRLHGNPTDAFNVGMLSYRIHDWTTAAEYLTLWLALVPPPGPSSSVPERDKHEQARVDLEQTRKHVGALVVDVSERGAEVLVNGRVAGTSPLARPLFVDPGAHRVAARLAGAQSQEVLVNAEAGREHTVRLVLPVAQRSSSAVPPSRPAQRDAPAPGPGPEPDAGSLGGPWVSVAMVAGLVGTGLIVTSVFVDSEAEAQRNALLEKGGPGACLSDAYRDACADLSDARTVSDALVGAGIASLAVAGAVVAGSLVTHFLAPAKQAPRAAFEVRPAVGAAGVGVQAVW